MPVMAELAEVAILALELGPVRARPARPVPAKAKGRVHEMGGLREGNRRCDSGRRNGATRELRSLQQRVEIDAQRSERSVGRLDLPCCRLCSRALQLEAKSYLLLLLQHILSVLLSNSRSIEPLTQTAGHIMAKAASVPVVALVLLPMLARPIALRPMLHGQGLRNTGETCQWHRGRGCSRCETSWRRSNGAARAIVAKVASTAVVALELRPMVAKRPTARHRCPVVATRLCSVCRCTAVRP
mmetsp:Transcript_10293/g.26615  ORF Transcript_10293/g.26615 Transcript_10293/m.26615 type:complete len:242 (+) Transcript_10293:592-1317(+)